MDFRKLAVEETSVVNLRNATDEPLVDDDGAPYTVLVYGPGSKQWGQAQAAQQGKLLQKAKRGLSPEFTGDERIANQVDLLVTCTKEFSPNIEYDGKKGEQLYRAVYSDSKLGFIAEQVAKHIQDWGNFSKPSTTNSPSTSDKSPG